MLEVGPSVPVRLPLRGVVLVRGVLRFDLLLSDPCPERFIYAIYAMIEIDVCGAEATKQQGGRRAYSSS